MKATLGTKIAAAMAGLAILTTAVGAVGYYTADTVDAGYSELLETDVALAAAASDLDIAAQELLAHELEYLVGVNEHGIAESADILTELDESQAHLDGAVDTLATLAAGTSHTEEVAGFQAMVQEYDLALEHLVGAITLLGDHEVGLRGELVALGHTLEEQSTDDELVEVERLLVIEERFLNVSDQAHADELLAQLATLTPGPTTAAYEEKVAEIAVEFDNRVVALATSGAVAAELDAGVKILAEETEAAEAAASELLSDETKSAELMMIIAIAAAIVIAATVATLMSRSISRAARTLATLARVVVDEDIVRLTTVAEAASHGDLTARYVASDHEIDVTRSDELGDIARSFADVTESLDLFGTNFNRTLTDLAATVEGIQRIAQGVRESSAAVSATSEETARGAAEIASSITEVADSATTQAAQSDSMLNAVGEIDESLNATMEALTSTTVQSDEARVSGEHGRVTLSQTTSAMDKITGSINVAAEHVTAMGDSSKEVEEIVELIRAIAEQTNLLALNAAIEAARAGELGRGFAVVAAEVKALAEESAHSTDKVAAVVSSMRQSVSKAIESMDDGLANVDLGNGSVRDVSDAFTVLDTSIRTIGSSVESLNAFGGRISDASVRIRGEAEGLLGLAEANSAATEQVAAASEESAAVAEELGATSEELSAAADELATLVARFRV